LYQQIWETTRATHRSRGSQFYANFGEIKAAGISKFQQYLIGRKINHILGRVHHPQTNGKIERFYETFQSKIQNFNSMEEFVIWYNTKRPHMSLNWEELETSVKNSTKRETEGGTTYPLLSTI